MDGKIISDDAIKKAPRFGFGEMPDCDHTPTSYLRWYKKTIEGQRIPGTYLEQLFLDGFGNPFWAPIPLVKE